MIRSLKNIEIDKESWDNCINISMNPLPYALSWWLDIVSPGWEALVSDDYTSVMPLTWNKRFGNYYLRQPWFTQQLGIFSDHVLSMEEISAFLNSIPKKFRFVEIQLNSNNNQIPANYQVTFRADHTLNLSPAYIQIESNYRRNCRRNIQKALQEGLYIKHGPGTSVFTRFTERNLEKSLSGISGLYDRLPELIQATIDRGYGTVYGVYDRHEELLAAAWFVNYSGRCFFMVCASTKAGKKNQAMYLLVDHCIREKAGSATVFDFTGSNIPGVAYFNTGFGATRQSYPLVKINMLPWYLKLFKR